MIRPTQMRVAAAAILSITLGCSTSSTPSPGDSSVDSQIDSQADANSCDQPCALDCELERDANGCAICRCAGPETECTTDSDCVLGHNLATCCSGCFGAFPTTVAQSERCIVTPGDPVPQDCQPAECGDVACVDGCAQALAATCNAGKCMPSERCDAPNVSYERIGVCHAPCQTHNDCAIAAVSSACCCQTSSAMPADVVGARTCLVEENVMRPVACEPTSCDSVSCPPVSCETMEQAACMFDGMCRGAPQGMECPENHAGDGTRCFPVQE